MITISDETQIIALANVLNHIKFRCEEFDCRYFAGSPVVGELYKTVSESLHSYYEKMGIQYAKEWRNIEELPHYIKTIEAHIKSTDNWKDLSNDVKTEVIDCLVYPYKINQETLNNLIMIGNEYHNLSKQ